MRFRVQRVVDWSLNHVEQIQHNSFGDHVRPQRRGFLRRQRFGSRHASAVASCDQCRQRWHRSGQAQKEMEEKLEQRQL